MLQMFKKELSGNDILNKIKALEPSIRDEGASALYVFGLKPNGDTQTGSDIDMFVDCDDDPDAMFPLHQLVAINELVGDELNLSVHITTRCKLNPAQRPEIEQRAHQIF